MQTRAVQRANERATVEGEQSRTERQSKTPTKIMNYDLVRLAKECPGMQVSITLGELIEAIDITIANVKSELEQTIADQKAETYPSREKAMEILDVSQATLWRWQKSGYLVPLNVGGKRRYRMSDIKRILEGNNAQKGAAS